MELVIPLDEVAALLGVCCIFMGGFYVGYLWGRATTEAKGEQS